MKAKKMNMLAILLLSLAISTIWALDCAGQSAKTIKLGALVDFTGPGSSTVIPIFKGVSDYVQNVNDQGGVGGAKIEITWSDTGYRVDRALVAYRRFKQDKIPGMYSFSSGESAVLKPMLAKDKIVSVSCGISTKAAYPPGWIFLTSPLYGDQLGGFCDWIKDTWKESRPPKIGLLLWDNSMGRAAETAIPYIKKNLGFEVLPSEYVPGMPTDSTAQLTRLKDRGADFVYLQMSDGAASVCMKDAVRLGLMNKIKFSGAMWVFTEELVKLVGGKNLEGFLGVTPYAFWDADVPGVRLMKETQQRIHGAIVPNLSYQGGWMNSVIMVQGIRNAIKAVGLNKLDGQAIKNGIEAIRNLENGDISPPMNYGPDKRKGTMGIKIGCVKNGKRVAITGWRTAPDVMIKK